MHSQLTLTILLALISVVYTEYDGVSDYYDPSPWTPILKPIEDRLKPVTVTPKYHKKYLIHSVAG